MATKRVAKKTAITLADVQRPELLYQRLQTLNERLTQLELERGGPVVAEDVTGKLMRLILQSAQSNLQAKGEYPLNVEALMGVLSQAQYGKTVVGSSLPTTPSAELYDAYTLGVKPGTPATLYYVAPGVPKTWTMIGQTGSTPSNMMTTDTAQTITGEKTFTGAAMAANVDLRLNSNAGFRRAVRWLTAGVVRWTIRANATAESGANAGSDMSFDAFTDAGGVVGTALTLKRSDLSATFGGQLYVVGQHGCRVVPVGTTALPNGVYSPISWGSVSYDYGTMFNAGSPLRVTVPADGRYLIYGSLAMDANTTGYRHLRITLNGSAITRTVTKADATGTTPATFTVQDMRELVAGDYIQLEMFQDSGGVLNSINDATRTFLIVHRVA